MQMAMGRYSSSILLNIYMVSYPNKKMPVGSHYSSVRISMRLFSLFKLGNLFGVVSF
jgi:hypothetical protein